MDVLKVQSSPPEKRVKKTPYCRELLSRDIFFLEFMLLGLPLVLFFGMLGLVVVTVRAIAALDFLLDLFASDALSSRSAMDLARELGGVSILFLLILSGLIALWHLVRLVLTFWNEGGGALWAVRNKFYWGLGFAILPLCLVVPIGFSAEEQPIGLYFSGVPLFVPIIHLWLEMRYRRPMPPAA